jgi:hypothetical protein
VIYQYLNQSLVAHVCNISYTGGWRSGGSWFGHPWQKVGEMPSQQQQKKMLDVVSGSYHPNNGGKCKIEGSWSGGYPGQCETLSLN